MHLELSILVVDLVLIERMQWSQISQGIQNTTQKFDCRLLPLINSQVLSVGKRS